MTPRNSDEQQILAWMNQVYLRLVYCPFRSWILVRGNGQQPWIGDRIPAAPDYFAPDPRSFIDPETAQRLVDQGKVEMRYLPDHPVQGVQYYVVKEIGDASSETPV